MKRFLLFAALLSACTRMPAPQPLPDGTRVEDIAVIAPCLSDDTVCDPEAEELISVPVAVAVLEFPIALRPNMQADLAFIVQGEWWAEAESGTFDPVRGVGGDTSSTTVYTARETSRTRATGYDVLHLRYRTLPGEPIHEQTFRVRVGADVHPQVMSADPEPDDGEVDPEEEAFHEGLEYVVLEYPKALRPGMEGAFHLLVADGTFTLRSRAGNLTPVSAGSGDFTILYTATQVPAGGVDTVELVWKGASGPPLIRVFEIRIGADITPEAFPGKPERPRRNDPVKLGSTI